MTKKEENWLMNYEELRKYLDFHGHLPDKHVVENRRLLNWVKYQRKRMKEELMPEEQRLLFDELLASRSAEHTGGRRKNQWKCPADITLARHFRKKFLPKYYRWVGG